MFLCSIRRTKIVAQVRPLPNYHGRNGNIYDMGWSLYFVGFNPTPCSYETLGLQLRHNPQALMEWRRMKLRIGVISEGTNPEKFHLQPSCPGPHCVALNDKKNMEKHGNKLTNWCLLFMMALHTVVSEALYVDVVVLYIRISLHKYIIVYTSIYIYVRIVCIVMLYSYRC